jgi:hypothetical protein
MTEDRGRNRANDRILIEYEENDTALRPLCQQPNELEYGGVAADKSSLA